MILSYHGRRTTVAECRDQCSPGRDGLTARTLARCGRYYGLRVRAYSVEPKELPRLPLPVVAHWEFNHFFVIESWSPEGVTVVDPACGRRALTREEFDAGFTGVILTFEPGVNFQKRTGRRAPAWGKYLFSMMCLPGTKSVLAQVLAASLALQLVGLSLPVLTKLLVDGILPQRVESLMGILGVGILLVVAAQSVLGFLRNSLLIYLRGRLDAHLMLNFFEHLFSLPYDFFQKRSGGDLLTRLGSNSFIREVLTNNVLSLLLDGSFVVIFLFILLSVAPQFGALVVGLGALHVLVTLGARRKVDTLMQKELAARAAEQGYLVEAISGVSMLKASGAEDVALDRWSNLFFEQLNISLARGRLSNLLDGFTGALRMLSPLLLLWFGAFRVLDGSQTLGTMLAMNALALSFLAPLAALIANGQQLILTGAHLERIADVLEAEPEQRSRPERPTPRLTGRVEARDLSFSYEAGGAPVLKSVSVSVSPGQKVALVGPTGSGKSTLAMLLLGLYQPTSGEILYDGLSLAQLDLGELRRQVGVVLQEPFLFSGSVMQNIALNAPDISFDKLVRAAEAAGIHNEIVRMSMGYETFIAEGGTMLSGGQRQRIAIARALAHEPAILLLDEASSHLDVTKEAEVERNLNALSCTRIVIAHRLSTVRNADLILVLDEGELVESGTHAELVTRGGRYAALVVDQLTAEASPLVGEENLPLDAPTGSVN